MHDTFSFTPNLDAPITKDLLLHPMKTVGSATAGAALRSFVSISANSRDIFPGLKWGRVHLPVPLVLHQNNIFDGKFGPPSPAQIIGVTKSQNGFRHWLIIYSDRSALIARKEEDCGKDLTHPLMRILPVVLKIASKAAPRACSRTYGISVTAQGDTAQIMATASKHAPAFPMVVGPYPDTQAKNDIGVIQSQIRREIIGWGNEIDRAPLVAAPYEQKRFGIFGEDQDAPLDTLVGASWGWPAAMEHTGFTEEQYKQAHRFYHLAYVHLAEQYKDSVHELFIGAQTAESRQDDKPGKATLKVIAQGKNDPEKKIEARIRSDYKKLLRHKKAPASLFNLPGQAVVEADRGTVLSRVRPWTIYHGHLNMAISHHDKIAAHALFGS
jgi:hypothetical protein